MKHITKAATLVLAGVLALSLSGCVGATEKSSPADKPEAKPAASDPSFAPEPEPEPEPTGNLAFGDAMTWEDGLALSASVPVAFTPSEYAAGGTLPHNVKITFTITNGSDANFEGYAYSTVTSGGAAGEAVFDSEQGLMGGPNGVILPGQTITWTEGWNIADPANIVLSVAPGFEYEDVIFTNVAG